MLLATTLASVVLAAAPDAGVPTKSVMHDAFDALTTLVWLTSRATPPTPAERETLVKELAKLEAVPHAFDAPGAAQEPGAAAVASLFSRYAATTRQRVDAGEFDTVGHRVRTMSGLCFACHTRERVPFDFKDAEKRFQSLALSPLERGRVLAATRQFDQALAAWAPVLAGPTAELDYARALEDSLTIHIRVKGDAAATGALLGQALARGDLPAVTRTALEAWRRDVQAWQEEKFDAAKASSDALLAKAEKLAKQGSDVALLRAAAYASQALSMRPKHPRRGEALWVLALCAERVRSPLLWDLDLLYLEACVRENPKTPLAKRCVGRLGERLTLGFTGSAGTNIPPDEQARLDELKALANGGR